MGKVATSPLPSRGSPPLAERGAKSEVAHLWAKWLCHPCRLGDPHRCRAGGKIRVGPLVGKVATSPLPSRGSPPLQSGGQNQKWPTGGQSGYVTPAVSGIPTASERGAKSEVAHWWAKWLRHPCRLGDPHRFKAGGKIRSGPLVGKVATSPLPSRRSPPLQSGGQNQKWPKGGQSGYVTPAVSGIPTACRAGGKIRSGPLVGKVATSPLPSRGSPPLAERGAKSEVAHWWAKWLRHPCRLGDPHRLQSGGQNQKWPACGQSGYVTPAVSGIPTACRAGGKIRSGPLVGKVATSPLPSRGSPPLAERGAKSEVARLWAKWLCHPCRLGDPQLQSGGQNQKWPACGQSGYVTPAVSGIPTALKRGAKSEVAHLWAKWLRHPCSLRNPHRFKARGKIRSGPLVGKVATSPLPSLGSPPLQSGGAKSEVAHLWAKWLCHPCRLGDSHRLRAGGKIRSGPLVGKVAMSPLPSRGSPPLQSGGAKSEVAHLWAKWLCHPCRLEDPQRFKAGGKIRSGPLVGKVATSPLPSKRSPPLQSGGQNQKWPTCGQSGYVTPAVSGIPTAAERGGKIRSGPLVGKVAMSPLPSRGSPPLRVGGQNQKWPTCGQSGYVTPAISGIPTASKRGAKSEVARLWA